MKNRVLVLLLMFSAIGVWAESVSSLLVLTTKSGNVQIPINSIQKITYNQTGTTMYVFTHSATHSYEVADITRMTLDTSTDPTVLNQLTNSPTPQLTKFEQDGVMYIVKEDKVYTLKGEKL